MRIIILKICYRKERKKEVKIHFNPHRARRSIWHREDKKFRNKKGKANQIEQKEKGPRKPSLK